MQVDKVRTWSADHAMQRMQPITSFLATQEPQNLLSTISLYTRKIIALHQTPSFKKVEDFHPQVLQAQRIVYFTVLLVNLISQCPLFQDFGGPVRRQIRPSNVDNIQIILQSQGYQDIFFTSQIVSFSSFQHASAVKRMYKTTTYWQVRRPSCYQEIGCIQELAISFFLKNNNIYIDP